MPRDYSNNFLATTLTSAIDAVVLSLTLAAAVPADLGVPFALTIEPDSATGYEIVEITGLDGTRTVCTITRGFDGTTARAHAAGVVVRHTAIAGDFTDRPTLSDADARYAQLTAANTFMAGQQTIQANARIGTTGASGARLRVDDNGSVASYLAEVHADDLNPYVLGLFNDTFSDTTPGLEAWIDDTGAPNLGSRAGQMITVYNDGDALTIGPGATAPITFLRPISATNLDTSGASDGQALVWSDATSRYQAGTVSGGAAVGMTKTTADNTGATNATAQLQTDMATAAAAGHRRLYLPAGTYKISLTTGTLFNSSTDYLEIFGDGIGKTILQLPASTTLTGALTFFNLTGKYQWIHDLTIQIGSGAAGSFDMTGIAFNAGAYFGRASDVEIVGIYGSSTAGGGGITTYQPYNQNEVATTLGTAIASGVRTVTPPDMTGIYAGRTLVIGGTTETIQVTSITATTFTATFANAHGSSDTVTGTSNGHQYCLIERCIVRDSYKCTGFIINSAANLIRGCKAIHVGSNSTQHGFYIQKGQTVLDGWYAEGVGGYSVHSYIDVTTSDSTGNRFVNGTSINPGTQHLIAQSAQASSGANPDIPNGEQLMRGTVVANNVFRRTKGAAVCAGVRVENGGIVANNLLEDVCGSSGNAWIFGNSGNTGELVVANNTLRVLNATANLGIVCYDNTVVVGNQIINWGSSGAAIRVDGKTRVQANNIKMTAGQGIMFNAGNATANDNIITATGGIPIQVNNPSLTNINCKNNDIFCSGSVSWAIDFQAASFMPTGSFINNRWSGAPARYYDAPAGLTWLNNQGNMSFRGNATQITLDADVGRLMRVAKGTNTHTAGLLVKFAGATLGTSDTVFYGVAVSTTDNTNNNAYLVGAPGCECPITADGAWTAGNVGVPSTTSAGKIHDSGSTTPPAAPASYVIFLDTGGAAGTARCLLVKTL